MTSHIQQEEVLPPVEAQAPLPNLQQVPLPLTLGLVFPPAPIPNTLGSGVQNCPSELA